MGRKTELAMVKIDMAYWQGSEPKTNEELQDQLQEAVIAAFQWLNVAKIDDDDKMMVYAQIYWLQELLKLSRIELRHSD